jgi:hypothetical protein
MLVKRALIVAGLLLVTAPSWADGPAALTPRKPIRKIPTAMLRIPDSATGRLVVKFNDDVKARATAQNRFRSLSNRDVASANDIVRRFGLSTQCAFKRSEERLRAIEIRAEQYSKKAQPDLAGIFYVTGPEAKLLDAAKALNDLEQVEWVEFERELAPCQDCADPGGPVGSCYEANDGPFCDDVTCCELIGEIDPYCIDPFGMWDELCAAYANLYCEGGDVCLSGPVNEDCFEPHDVPGCRVEDCCNAVCDVEPFCCDVEWDETCVQLAEELCYVPGGGGVTPDFEDHQGYLTETAYDFDNLPPGLDGLIPDVLGFGGQGWNLGLRETDDDDPEVRYNGIYGVARELYEVYGIDRSGDGPLGAQGLGQKVGVIEWAYYEGHEDLHVQTENGQTLIVNPEITEPDHATACLGIINAQDNGIGTVGIAPLAEAHFFPLTSVEEGPRQTAAWLSALEEFGPGDVISCSFGPPPENLNTTALSWLLCRLSADIGIVVCMAAGNSCFDLDDATLEDPIDGDSGGIVVGAGSPGFPYYRLAFSNFYTGDKFANLDPDMVHVQAWGTLVTTCGYGDLYYPDGDENRAYTATFGGTSAAAPQIAGLAACVQGLAKQFFGVPLQPETVRSVISSAVIPQCGNFYLCWGFPDEFDCGVDSDPDEGPNKIGGYPVAAGQFNSVASRVLNTFGFDGAPLVQEVYIVRGNKRSGNVFSVKMLDNLTLNVDSVFTPRNFRPKREKVPGGFDEGGTPPQVEQIRYIASGDIVDLVIKAEADIPTANSLVIQNIGDVGNPPLTAFLFVEAYDWTLNRWEFIDFQTLAGPYGFDSVASDPQRFMRSDGRILARIWTLGFTLGSIGGGGAGGTGGGGLYQLQANFINVFASEEFGEEPPAP